MAAIFRPLAKLATTIALTGASLPFASIPAQALTLFAGYYAPANWTQNVQGDGSISTSNAPNNITLIGADDFGGNQNTDFTIAAPNAGTVSFDWTYASQDNDGPEYDPFGYLLNGSFTQLTNNSGDHNQTGSASFSVLAGDVFGFRQNSFDSVKGVGSTTISNFSGPAPVPAPLPVLGSAFALSACCRLRRQSKRLRLASGTGHGLRA